MQAQIAAVAFSCAVALAFYLAGFLCGSDDRNLPPFVLHLS